ncbi:hypothetical protein D3C81_1846430 [compost metagenome]
MALDELAIDYAGMARRQARRHAQAFLDRAHVRLFMVLHGETVVLQVFDPGLAAAAIGVAIDIDVQCLCGLGQGAAGQQCQQRDAPQWAGLQHGGILL